MKNASYPPQYKNLLIKAGLLGTGIKEVHGIVLNTKLKTFDESSQTFSEGSEPEVDHRKTMEYFVPIMGENGRVEGDWRNGLTADEVRIINEECGVPVFTTKTRLYLHHGKMYNMEDPSHVAEYRILDSNKLVADSRKSVATGQRFYYHDSAQEQQRKESERKVKRTAIELDETLTLDEKRDLLQLVNYEKRLGISEGLSDRMLRESFGDLAYNRYADLVEVSEMPNHHLRLLLHQSIGAAILFREGTAGTVSRPNGAKLADSFEEAVQLLVTDQGIRLELENKLHVHRGSRMAERMTAVAEKKFLLTRYDTTIHNEKSVEYWNKEACMQYFKDNQLTADLTEADGVERWRNLVIKVHRGENPKEVFDPQQGMSESARVAVDIRSRVDDWTRQQCEAFLEEHKVVFATKGFDSGLNDKSNVAKCREAVRRALSLFGDEEVRELLVEPAAA